MTEFLAGVVCGVAWVIVARWAADWKRAKAKRDFARGIERARGLSDPERAAERDQIIHALQACVDSGKLR